MADELPAVNASRAPYLHIADVLRGEIRDGRYAVGEHIPSQAELEERFQVSRPTVQRALVELRKDGYLDTQRGRASKVLPWRDRRDSARARFEEPEPTYAVLAAHIAEAFEQPHVTIDSFSLTTETLNTALVSPLQRVQLGELHPTSITVRLLLPDQDAHLAIPRSVGDPGDERPLRRLRQLILSHVVAVRSAFTALTDRGLDIEQSVEIRAVPLTPTHKLYLINKRTALSGYYKVAPRSIEFGSGVRDDIYDVLGINAVLFPYRSDPAKPASRDSRFVAESQEWFDSVWSTIARPVTLIE